MFPLKSNSRINFTGQRGASRVIRRAGSSFCSWPLNIACPAVISTPDTLFHPPAAAHRVSLHYSCRPLRPSSVDRNFLGRRRRSSLPNGYFLTCATYTPSQCFCKIWCLDSARRGLCFSNGPLPRGGGKFSAKEIELLFHAAN